MELMKKITSHTASPLFVVIACTICLLVGFSINSSIIEIFASVMGILNVWLLSREKVSNFIFGIITVVAYLYIYYNTGLYALAILACFQIGFNIFGWYYWVKNSDQEDNVVTSGLTKKGQIMTNNMDYNYISSLGSLGLCRNKYITCSKCNIR